MVEIARQNVTSSERGIKLFLSTGKKHFRKFDPKCWRLGREPWSSGNGIRLMFWKSWVRIPAQYSGWRIFVVKIVMMFVWRDKNKWEKNLRKAHFYKKCCRQTSFRRRRFWRTSCWSSSLCGSSPGPRLPWSQSCSFLDSATTSTMW